MSAVVAILNPDRRPVDRVKLERMLVACAHRGPDGQGVWVDEHVGLGQAMLHTTPESLRETQPFSLDGRAWIVADARIDNREDLIAALGSEPGADLRQATDVELILRAYRAWGEECAGHLLGDFAFLIWDASERRLLGVRDPLGVKQLYLYEGQGTFLAATTIASILAGLDHRPPLNEELIISTMADDYTRRHTETVYRGIHPIQPAHQFVLTGQAGQVGQTGRLVERRYYDWASAEGPKYRTDQQYIEHFRELLTSAVKCRARCQAAVGLQVSGGIDSSSVACILRHNQQEWGRSDSRTFLYSCVSEQFPKMDERKYFRAVAEQCAPWGVRELNADQMWPLKDIDKDPRLDEPAFLGVVMNRPYVDTLATARGDGCCAVLSGIGADEQLLGIAYDKLWLLRWMPWRRLFREWRYFARATKCSMFWLLLRGLVYPHVSGWIPGPVDDLLRGMVRWRRGQENAIPNWLAAEKLGGVDTEQLPCERRGHGHPNIKERVASFVHHGEWCACMAYFDQMGGLAQLEMRFPFLDRRLLEFSASLPTQMFCREGRSKWVLGEAVKGVTPELVRTRTTHGTCQDLIGYAWRQKERPRIEHLLQTPESCRLNLAYPDALKAAWQRYWSGDETELWNLSAWLNTEQWLRGAAKEP